MFPSQASCTDFPERKAELVGQVAKVKQQIEQGQFDEAKAGLLALGKVLKEAASAKANTQQVVNP